MTPKQLRNEFAYARRCGASQVARELFEDVAARDRKTETRKLRRVCTCADEDFCLVHPTDTDSLDPNGPWGQP